MPGYDKKPIEIPDLPMTIYSNEYVFFWGWGDWLGVDYLDDFIAHFRNQDLIISDYLDGYQKKTSMYKYEISEEQINEYIAIFYKIDDDNIHEMIANLNYKQLKPDILNKILHVQNKYTEFISTLLANPTISLEIKIKYILMDEDNTDKENVLNLISHLNANVDEEEQVKKLTNAFEQSINSLPYTPNFTNLEDSNIIISKLEEQLKRVMKKQAKKNYRKENLPKKHITPDEFEKLFELKTKKYLAKKEKSFSDPLQFEEFLNSDKYKQINTTRRNQIMEECGLIDTTTSKVYNASNEMLNIHKTDYDEHGFDKNGIHKDTGYSTDKYGNGKDYYADKNKPIVQINKPSIQTNQYDEHGFDKDGIHQDTGYLTDKYGYRKDYYKQNIEKM